MKAAGIIGVCLALIGVGAVWYARRPCEGIGCIDIPGKSFAVRETYERQGRTWRGLLASGDVSLRLETVGDTAPEAAEEFTKLRMMYVTGLFDTALSPYPGAISHTIRCDDSYKPKPVAVSLRDGTNALYFSSFMNNRMQYGACTDSQVAYRSGTGIWYCAGSRTWVFAEVMAPKDKTGEKAYYETVIRSISCK